MSPKSFFGHPRGLTTLFFTEMWERFSYYGMRALLILFMSTPVIEGGFGFDDRTSGAIYGLYTMGVYLLALPGGWVADNLIGLKKSVWYGGIIIALGHFTMGIPGILSVFYDHNSEVSGWDTNSFFLGLILVVLGTGMLKPNISVMVGELYTSEENTKRDAGFSIFYMGINFGALIAPLLTSAFAEVNWHLGFGIAGFGMVLGLVQYRLTSGYVATVGNFTEPATEEEAAKKNKYRKTLILVLGLLTLFLVLTFSGLIPINVHAIARSSGVVIAIVAFGYLMYVYLFGGLDRGEKKRVIVIALIFILASVFWSGFEQAGSTLNLFAERFTNRKLLGYEIPAGWFQSVNSIFLVIFAPVFAAMWVWLAKRHLEPNSPLKFAFGLILLGIGFFVMYFASKIAATGDFAAPSFLIFTYMFHTFGELSLSPVGLSLITKLAPKRFTSRMMGVWFLATSLGNLIAGLVAGETGGGTEETLANMPSQYMLIVCTTAGVGVVVLIFNKNIKKLMRGIH